MKKSRKPPLDKMIAYRLANIIRMYPSMQGAEINLQYNMLYQTISENTFEHIDIALDYLIEKGYVFKDRFGKIWFNFDKEVL